MTFLRGARPASGHPAAAAALVAVALFASACGSTAKSPGTAGVAQSSRSSSQAATKSLLTAVVEIPNVDLNYFPLFVAQKQGYFERHGVRVKLETMPPPVALAALLKGEIQFIGVGGTALQAAWKGLPVRLVDVIADRPQYVLVAPTAISKPSQLRGKGIAVNNPNDGVSQLTMAALKHYGLGVHAYTFVGVGADGKRLAALKAGTVAAAMLEPGHIQLAQKEGLHIVFNISKVLPPVPMVSLATTTSFIAKHAAVTRGVVSATVEAIRYIESHPAAAKAAIAKKFNLSPSGAAGAYADAIKSYSPDGRVSEAGIREAIELGALMASRNGGRGGSAFRSVPAKLSAQRLAHLTDFSLLPARPAGSATSS